MEVIIANTQTDRPSAFRKTMQISPPRVFFHLFVVVVVVLITELAVFLLLSKVLVKLKHKTNSCVHLSKQGPLKPQLSHQSFLFWHSLY